MEPRHRLKRSGVVVGKKKHINWSLKLKVSSTKEQGDLQALQEQRAALRSELGMKVFKSGEEEYKHMLLDIKTLDLGHQQLQAEVDHVMFSPDEETEAREDLDIILRGEELCFRLRYHIKRHLEGERWDARLQSVGERWSLNHHSVGKEWYARTHPAVDLTGAMMKGMRQAKGNL